MEGVFRPGHLTGMATVVEKLLKIIKPDLAFFGQKDLQQLQNCKDVGSTNELQNKNCWCKYLQRKKMD